MLSGLFGNSHIRPITPLEVEPADTPDHDKDDTLAQGRLALHHLARRAELTVAASQVHYAALAADRLRGRW